MSLIEISCFGPGAGAPTDFAAPLLRRYTLKEDILSHLVLVLCRSVNVLALGPRPSCKGYIAPNAIRPSTFGGTWNYGRRVIPPKVMMADVDERVKIS
jgi:hypothetical protein